MALGCTLSLWLMYAAEATNHQEGNGCGSGHPELAEDHWRSVGSSASMP